MPNVNHCPKANEYLFKVLVLRPPIDHIVKSFFSPNFSICYVHIMHWLIYISFLGEQIASIKWSMHVSPSLKPYLKGSIAKKYIQQTAYIMFVCVKLNLIDLVSLAFTTCSTDYK